MMITYNDLQKEFERKVKDLQANCSHKRLTPWLEEWWSIGHSTGNVIRRCKYCNKVVEKEGLTENYRKRFIKGD